jgi:ATP-dependent Clp protease protease subunit
MHPTMRPLSLTTNAAMGSCSTFPPHRSGRRRWPRSGSAPLLLACVVAVMALPACKRRQTQLSHAELAQLDVRTLLLKHRTILLQGSIDERMAQTVRAQVHALQRMDHGAPVKLLIDSPGGDLRSALSIRSTVGGNGITLHTHCLGAAHGPALFLLARGARGHRTAAPEAQLSLQPVVFAKQPGVPPTPSVSRPQPLHIVLDPHRSFAVERPSTVRNEQEVREEEENNHRRVELLTTLASDTGQEFAQIEKDVAASRHFDAAEAMEYGLIDRLEL